MLTWGGFNIVGGSPEQPDALARSTREPCRRVQAEIDELGVETDGNGWRAKVSSIAVEARCPQTGWMVPLVAVSYRESRQTRIAELVPDHEHKRYDIVIRSGVNAMSRLTAARKGPFGRTVAGKILSDPSR